MKNIMEVNDLPEFDPENTENNNEINNEGYTNESRIPSQEQAYDPAYGQPDAPAPAASPQAVQPSAPSAPTQPPVYGQPPAPAQPPVYGQPPAPGYQHPGQPPVPPPQQPPVPGQPPIPGGGYNRPPIPGYYPMYNMGPAVQKPRGSGGKIALICIISAAVILITGIIIYALSRGSRETSEKDNLPPDSSRVEASFGESSDIKKAPSTKADPDAPQVSAADSPDDFSDETRVSTDVYKKSVNSVVCITSYDQSGDYITSADGEGSGIVLTEDGYIATNSHVVNDSKKTGVLVSMHDEKQYLGTIIGIDKKTDLAVIKIDAEGLTPAEFTDSDKITIGQQSFALGNPGGSEFSFSLTKGAISAVDRVLSGSGYIKYIQTDAAINPGNSGGALLNEFGQVIGMNTAKLVATDYEGMGFAIPSNTVLEIVNKIIRYGYVNDRGTLGIEGKTCTLYMSKVNNVPQGMLVTKVESDGPSAKTSLKANDIITEINGVRVESAADLIDELKKYKPDDIVKMKVYRPSRDKSSKGYEFTVEVRLKADTGK